MEYFVAKDQDAVIGLGNSESECLTEPLDNGYERDEITLTQIDKEEYENYINLYT